MLIKNLVALIALYLFWAALTLFNYFQTNKSLRDHAAITGTVDKVEIITLSSKKDTRAIAFSLNNSQLRFGFQDKYQTYYDSLKNIDLMGKVVTVYYNPLGVHVENNLTLWIGQLIIDNEIFFPIEASKDYHSFGLKIQLIFLTILTIVIPWAIYKYIKDKVPLT